MNMVASRFVHLMRVGGVKPLLWMIGGGSLVLLFIYGVALWREPGTRDERSTIAEKARNENPVTAIGTESRTVPPAFIVAGLCLLGVVTAYEVIAAVVRKENELVEAMLAASGAALERDRTELEAWHQRESERFRRDAAEMPFEVERRTAEGIEVLRQSLLRELDRSVLEAKKLSEAARLERAALEVEKAKLLAIDARESAAEQRERRASRAEGRVTRARAMLEQLKRENERLVVRIDAGCGFIGAALIEYLLDEPHVLSRLVAEPLVRPLLAELLRESAVEVH